MDRTAHQGGRIRLFFAVMAALLALAAAAPAADAGPALRGVQLHAMWGDMSTADMDRELDLVRGANANVVRVDVGWAGLEDPGKGQWSKWTLDRLDHLMSAADARGVKVIAMLWGTPCWASSAPAAVRHGCKGASGDWWADGVQYAPVDAADYGDFARFVTARYGSKLAAVEVWNEPDIGDRFLRVPDNADAYAKLVKAGYTGAKAGDPRVPVLMGSLCQMDRRFLDKLWARGVKGFYDGISIHPYTDDQGPASGLTGKASAFRAGIEAIRDAQRSVGDDTPLWLTEFGWTTSRGGAWHVDEARQALFTADAFAVLATMPYVRGATVYELRDRSGDPNAFESHFGMVTADYKPKPAYAALKAALTLGGGGGPAEPAAAASAPLPAAAPTAKRKATRKSVKRKPAKRTHARRRPKHAR